MKKRFLFLLLTALMLMTNVNMMAIGVDIQLCVEIIDPENGQGDPNRGPNTCPHVSLEVHTLYFNNVGYDLTLVLVDEDNEVAYTTLIPAHTSSIILPHYLDGDYKIELFPGGDYYFYGWIVL